MKSSNRSLCLILAAMLAALPAVSCGGEAAAPAADTTAADTTTAELTDGLPAKSFGGAEFNILCRTDKAYEFDIEEETGDNVDDAVYRRNLAVEDRYDVNIKAVTMDGDWNAREAFMKAITEDVMSGDGSYDLVAGYNGYITNTVLAGECLDINTLPHINFANPWWYEGFNKNMEIKGKLYMCLGDASLTMWENLQVVYFNKKLIENFGLPAPYEQIEKDNWTHDTLCEYSKLFSDDVDKNGTLDEKDHWGITFYNIRDYLIYCETPYCTIDESGLPEISLFTDRFVDVYQTIFNTMWTHNYSRQFAPDMLVDVFAEDRSMFLQAPLRYSELFRGMESDFGIVPFPKYDKNQKSYYTPVVDDLSVFVVPVSVKDKELSAYMLEALCFESWKTVVPEYFEVALTRKYIRDNESEAMLSLIRDTVWFEFGYTYSQMMGNIGSFIDRVRKEEEDVASAWNEQLPTYEAGLAKLKEFYTK